MKSTSPRPPATPLLSKERGRGRGSRIVLAVFLTFAARIGAQPADPNAPSPLTPLDVVEVTGGDRISGDIKYYSEGQLIVDTKHEGDVSIKWNKIVSIRSAKQFEVQMPDGSYRLGSLEPSDPPGKMVIVRPAGLVVVPFIEVVSITPIFQTFFGRIDGAFDLGLNYTGASDLFQFNTSFNATYKKPQFELLTSLSAFLSTQHGDTTSQRGNLNFGYHKFLSKLWLWGGIISFENNLDQGLKLRSSMGLFGGRLLVLQNQTSMYVVVGLQGNNEKATTGKNTQNLEGFIEGRYKTFTYDFPRLWFEAYVQVLPGITDAPRFRVNSQVQAKREMLRDVNLSISVFYSYDSAPPAANAARTDWGPIIAVGWTF